VLTHAPWPSLDNFPTDASAAIDLPSHSIGRDDHQLKVDASDTETTKLQPIQSRIHHFSFDQKAKEEFKQIATGDAGSQRSDVSHEGDTHKKNQEVVVDVGPRAKKCRCPVE
jgi:hypothetical protein